MIPHDNDSAEQLERDFNADVPVVHTNEAAIALFVLAILVAGFISLGAVTYLLGVLL